jgi:3-deoxy-D-manno-octulosonic-acid transferase
MRLLYTLLWYLVLPVLFVRLWWRGRRAPAYRRRWKERLALGLRSRRLRGSIWVHAVSVGETLAAAPLVRALLERYPETPLVVTTTTPTGSERVQALFGDRVTHVYAPWDLPGALARFFRAFDPRLILVMETELWPNLVHAAWLRHVPVVLVNGRLSQSSYRGYARVPALTGPMLASLDRLLVQTPEEADRFRRLGAQADQVEVTGNIKFDLSLDDELRDQARSLRAHFGKRPVWIAASTHEGEDEVILDAHARVREQVPEALLVLVPRHPERFETVAELIRTRGMAFARRSAGAEVGTAAVYLGDTMGELLLLFGTADVAFVGGSLVPVGGHNLLEPAAWGCPVLTGPRLHNFEHVAALLEEARAMTLVDEAPDLAEAVVTLLRDPETRGRQGEAGAGVVAAHRGALQRVLGSLSDFWSTE